MIKKYFYFLLFTFFLLILFTSCSSPTSTPKGSLSGTVNLEGQADHSEIMVAIYDLAELDPDIVSINQEYPHIGVIISQHTEFDHRLQTPVKYTETDAAGNFEIKKIPTGTYNIVALKDSFGFKYIYEVEIEEGENQLTPRSSSRMLSGLRPDRPTPLFNPIEGEQKEIPLLKGELKGVYSSLRTDADITLYAEQHISGDWLEDVSVEPWHHLVIDDDTNIVPGTSLTLGLNAIIRINPGIDLTIYGTLYAQGEENNMFWVTSNHGFENESSSNFQFSIFNFQFDRSEDIAIYNNFELTEICNIEDDLIEWGKFDFANICLLNQVNNLHMQNGIFRNGNCGFYSSDVDSTFCENLVINYCSSEFGSINFNFTTSGVIVKNIVTQANIGIMLDNESSPQVMNNYIKSTEEGIFTRYKCFSEIRNNEIFSDYIGISIRGFCYEDIINNNIYSDICINIPPTVYCGSSQANIHYNNFDATSYAIFILGYQSNPNLLDINAINNYYYTTEQEEIEMIIYDKNDMEESNSNYPYTGIVIWDPYSTIYIQDAGIN